MQFKKLAKCRLLSTKPVFTAIFSLFEAVSMAILPVASTSCRSRRNFPVASAKLRQSHHVVDQIHHSDLEPCTQKANRADEVPAHLRLSTEHVLDPRTNFGFRSIHLFLRVVQRAIARSLFANCTRDAGVGQLRFSFL